MRFTDTKIGIDVTTKIPAEATGGIKGHTIPGDIAAAFPAAALTIAKTSGLQSALDTLQSNIDAIDPQITALTNEDIAINLRVDDADSAIIILDGRVDGHDTDIATLDGRVDGHDADVIAINAALASKANLAGGNTFTGTQTMSGVHASYIDFANGANPAYTEGRVFYDNTDKSLVYCGDDPNTRMNIGRELWVKVTNGTGVTITNGQVVHAIGAAGGTTVVDLAQGTNYEQARVLGIATHDILPGGTGYVTALGEVNGLNTAAFTDGDALYLSPTVPGGLINAVPEAPNIIVRVGIVQRVSATIGKLYVHINLVSSTSDGITDATFLATPETVARRSATGGANFNELGIAGNITVDKTLTTSGVTGGVTIHKNFGSVNFANNMTSLVVVNNRVTPNSIILTTKASDDQNAVLGAAVATNGQFTIFMDKNPNSEVKVNFMVVN